MNTDEAPRFWNIWQCIVHGWVGLINGPAHAAVCRENIEHREWLEKMLHWPNPIFDDMGRYNDE
jgi:hypothetical protein